MALGLPGDSPQSNSVQNRRQLPRFLEWQDSAARESPI